MNYLFFDTETTGLPKNYKAPARDVDNWPRLVQLAYQVYSGKGKLLHEDEWIVKPDGFEIPENASNIHGITTEKALQEGHDIQDVLENFSAQARIYAKGSFTPKTTGEILIAHNMRFDEKIMGAEFIRSIGENPIEKQTRICTMLNVTDYCAIPTKYGYKWPKLMEWHTKLFGVGFEDAHDALNDVRAMAKCFWQMSNEGFNFEEL